MAQWHQPCGGHDNEKISMSVRQTTGLTDDSHISSALSSTTRHALPVAAGRGGTLKLPLRYTRWQASNSSRGTGTWNLAGSEPLGFTDAKEARLNQRQKRMHDEDVCIYAVLSALTSRPSSVRQTTCGPCVCCVFPPAPGWWRRRVSEVHGEISPIPSPRLGWLTVWQCRDQMRSRKGLSVRGQAQCFARCSRVLAPHPAHLFQDHRAVVCEETQRDALLGEPSTRFAHGVRVGEQRLALAVENEGCVIEVRGEQTQHGEQAKRAGGGEHDSPSWRVEQPSESDHPVYAHGSHA